MVALTWRNLTGEGGQADAAVGRKAVGDSGMKLTVLD